MVSLPAGKTDLSQGFPLDHLLGSKRELERCTTYWIYFLALPSSLSASSLPSLSRVAPATSPIIQRGLALKAGRVVNFEKPRAEIGVDEHVVPQQLEAATILLLLSLLLLPLPPLLVPRTWISGATGLVEQTATGCICVVVVVVVIVAAAAVAAVAAAADFNRPEIGGGDL